jgi:uncharacterized membrane protein YdjX (TVP38/TMEM64 family)
MSLLSWRNARRLIPIAVVAGLFVAVLASGLLGHLNLSELEARRAYLTASVAARPVVTLAAYFAIYVLVVVACVPGVSFMSTAGGFLFGIWLGGATALASCVVGSALVFQACRTAFGDWAASRAGPAVARIEAGFSKNAFVYLLTLRLLPMAPFFAVNVAAGLARARLRSFVAATALGTAPATFIFASLGAGLGDLFDRGVKPDFNLLATPQVLWPLAGLALLGFVPLVWRFMSARWRSS